jgi:uncharacterized membrane protein
VTVLDKIGAVGAAALLAAGVAGLVWPQSLQAIAQAMSRIPVGQPVPAAKEISIVSLKSLLVAAKRTGGSVAYIGGPAWAVDSTAQPKPGAYLLDDGSVITVAAQ